jgi:hypothetical protein
LRGYWRLEDGAYHGSGVGECESYTGDPHWTDYTLEAELTPLTGDHHLINLRVQGALRSYAFGLAPEGWIALFKKDATYRLMTALPFAWEHGKTYRLTFSAEGDILTASATASGDSVAGATQTLTTRDAESPYLNGQIGLSTWGGGHTAFRAVKVR